jgi:large subunit ribosomal protein L14
MISISTRVTIVDNSGALEGGCINVLKMNSRIGAVPGCLITISVKKNVFKKNIKKKSRIITKGQIVKALVITTVKGLKRVGNFRVRTRSNNSILLNQYLLPYGTRIFGPIFREIRQKINYRKVVSLARATI